METLLKFLERAIGPFIFVSAMTVFIINYNSEERFLSNAKSTYLSDNVYSQKNSSVEYTETVSSSELVGILIANPSIELEIINNGGGRVISVVPLTNGSMNVTVTEGLVGTTKEVYSKTMFNFQGFNMNYVEAGDYTISYKYNASGELIKTTYKKVIGGDT